MEGVLSFLRTIGAARLGAMGAVAAILVGFFAFIVIRLSQPVMAPLYYDLSLEDSAAIVRELDSQGVPYELKAGGGTIDVPTDQVLKLRMQLAGEGIPTGGSVGYEIFDKSNTLGATSFVQNINHVRALEGELARTIRAIDRIAAVRVHLVIPERQLFQRDRSEPSASIVLKIRGSLDSAQVRAVQHLVASAVDGLKPERVSIVDETGRLLASGAGSGEGGLTATALDERAVAHQRRLREQIEEIVSSVVGPGRARVQVAAELDFNRITRTADTFDPNGQVVRSTQSRTEAAQSANGRSGAVSVGNSLPDGAGQKEDNAAKDTNSTTDETTNYEISRTSTTEVIEAGRLKRVSVAVLVDGVYTANDKGEVQYAPRQQEEIDRIAALVRSAVGFDKARGDTVEVINLRFAAAPNPEDIAAPASAGGFFGLNLGSFGISQIFYLVELALSVVLGLLVVFMVIRPLVRRIVTPDENTGQLALAGPAQAQMLIAPPPVKEIHNETAVQIERAVQTGALQADTIKRVGTLVQDNPSEAVTIVRTWLAEPA